MHCTLWKNEVIYSHCTTGTQGKSWAAFCCQNVNKLFTTRSHLLTLHRKVSLYVHFPYVQPPYPINLVRTTVQPASVRCQPRKLRIFAILPRKVFSSDFQETLSSLLTDFLQQITKRVFSVKKPRNLVNRVDRLSWQNSQKTFLRYTSKILRKLLD